MKFRLKMRDSEMRGRVRAPQYGLQRMKAREVSVNQRRITQAELEELARLMQGVKP